jgi:4-amino-4-deoxy-L-arabinose transferase-like glycosyltransferase
VHTLVRKHRWFFLGSTLAGLALRLIFFFHFPAITDDSRVYGDLAANWLQHGIYGETQGGAIVPTDARLPGYPAFLAAIFLLFGAGNFKAALLVQLALDLLSCAILADLARRMLSDRAARSGFLLACLCPFLANYSAAALTESLETLFTVVALDCAVAGLNRWNMVSPNLVSPDTDSPNIDSPDGVSWTAWAGSGAAIAACILLRPDGGILVAGIGLYLLCVLGKRWRARRNWLPVLKAATAVSLCAFAPLVPWTIRNFHTLQHFQPLAPRYANEQDELVLRGFNRWVRTWMADYTSVEEIYWKVPGDSLDSSKLPNRAFDSPRQRETTLALISDYNQSSTMNVDLDARFGQLAAERIRERRLRYYVALPLLRVADMWLRPRTEILPPDPRWWEFDDVPSSLLMTVGLGLVNLVYVGAACWALLWRRSQVRYLGLLLLFVVLRSAFLGSLENPESRYTLECYPVVILLAAALWERKPCGERRAT